MCRAIRPNFSLYFPVVSRATENIWKQSTVIPVAKHNHPKVLNDFRPVALTSLVMKCFEKLVKKVVLTKTENLLDPLQFVYRAKRGVR